MQRAPGTTGEPGAVQEDARPADHFRVGSCRVAEHIVLVDGSVLLPEAGRHGGRQSRDVHGLALIGELGADGATTLSKVLGRLVENALAAPTPDARPVRLHESAFEAPSSVAIDDVHELFVHESAG